MQCINKPILQKMHHSSETGAGLSVLAALQIACFATAVQSSGCSATDTVCQCTTGKDKITNSVTPCIEKSCSADDASSTCPLLLFLSQYSGHLQLGPPYLHVQLSTRCHSLPDNATLAPLSSTSQPTLTAIANFPTEVATAGNAICAAALSSASTVGTTATMSGAAASQTGSTNGTTTTNAAAIQTTNAAADVKGKMAGVGAAVVGFAAAILAA